MNAAMKNDLFEALSNTSDNVYIFENDINTNRSRWSDNAIWYFDLPPEYVTQTMKVWSERIHPDDRAAYSEDIEAVFSGKQNRHAFQYRALNRFGDYVWLDCTGNIVKDEEGNPRLFAGTITRLDNQSKYDAVTKCLSLPEFYRNDKMDTPCVALIVGVDNFRRVINQYGYEMGNRVLMAIAKEFTKQPETQRVYRMSGDEFLILLPDADEKTAKAFFRRVQEAVRDMAFKMGVNGIVTFSGAADLFTPGTVDKETLLMHLEHSMEHAKKYSRGELVFFTKEIEDNHIYVNKIRGALQTAIENDFQGFSMCYQPIKECATGKIRRVESLLRFYTEELGLVSPVDFISILESNREIRKVGLWVMEQAVKQQKLWSKDYPDMIVGFNVSYLQLYDDSFVKQLLKTVEKYDVDPSRIAVELTESCRIQETENIAHMFSTLIDHGFHVALDDFGMEYSSLTLIRDIPVTTVKIEHSFVRTLTGNDSRKERVNLAIISCIIEMCHKLSIRVVVEGVENETVEKIISQMGAELMQGYFFSKPIPAAEVEKLFN